MAACDRSEPTAIPAPTASAVPVEEDASVAEPKAAVEPGSVFVIMMDTLRADSLMGAADVFPVSEGVRRLVRDSAVFTNAYAPSSWTRTSVATLLTGLEPHGHRVYGRLHKLDDDVATLAEALRSAGFGTFAWSTNPNVLPVWGFGQGFDEFTEVPWDGAKKPTASVVFDDVEEFITSRPPERALYYIHLMDPHQPYHPGAKLLAKAGRAGSVRSRKGRGRSVYKVYVASIAEMEARLGEFVEFLIAEDLYSQSLIVLVSDHGEEFEEHGGLRHGKSLYEEVLRVPLIVKQPLGRASAGVRDQRVGLADVVPTLLAELDLPRDPRMRGRPLLSAPLEGRAQTGVLYMDGKSIESVVQEGWKLIVNRDGPEELYDLTSDPGEQRNRIEDEPERAATLRELLLAQRGLDQAGWQIVGCAGEEAGVIRFALTGAVDLDAARAASFESDDVFDDSDPQRIEMVMTLKPFKPGGDTPDGEEWTWARVLEMSQDSMDSILIDAGDPPLFLESTDDEPLRFRIGPSDEFVTANRVSLQEVREQATEPLLRTGLCAPPEEVGPAPYLALRYVRDPAAVAPSAVDPEMVERLKQLGYHW